MGELKTRSRDHVRRIKILLIAVLFFTGCRPSGAGIATAIVVTLPPPHIEITHAVTYTPAPSLTIIPTPLPEIIQQTDISVLANKLFADRLIQTITIPSIQVESAVTPVGWRYTASSDFQAGQYEWDSPGADVGWVITSALPDETGNILVYGHNNMYEEVFKNLGDLQHGDRVYLQTAGQRWEYEVRQVFKLLIFGANENQLVDYQKYLQPTHDKRLTLISCWPPISNTHRVVIIARPVAQP